MKQLTSYNRVAGYLNKIFDLLNAEYFECALSRPTITIQSTPRAYGHFTLNDDTWVSTIGKTGTHSGGVEIGGKPPRTSSTRKYICPCCGMSVRATRTVRIACIDCDEQMVEV